MSFVIFKTAKVKIKIAKMESSSPSYGRKVRNTVPIPKAESNPMPQAAHPGAKTPRKIPVVAKTPLFPENFFISFVL